MWSAPQAAPSDPAHPSKPAPVNGSETDVCIVGGGGGIVIDRPSFKCTSREDGASNGSVGHQALHVLICPRTRLLKTCACLLYVQNQTRPASISLKEHLEASFHVLVQLGSFAASKGTHFLSQAVP